MTTEDKARDRKTLETLQLDDIPNATFIDQHLTHINPDWIDAYIIEQYGEFSRDQAWRSLMPQWLEKLGEEMSGDYRLDESKNFTVLQPAAAPDPEQTLAHAERSRDLIEQLWHGLAIEQEDAVGKHVAIVAASQDDYYDYLAAYYPDGDYGGSGGFCIRNMGYTHLVINQSSAWHQRATLTHEIAHALMAQLTLPAWVEEGMVQLAEDHINGTDSGGFDISEHRDFWSQHSFAGLWLGSAFQGDGPGQALAYQLARLMVYQLVLRDRERFIAFANQAHYADAGQEASLNQLGHGLAECLPAFLRIAFESPR